MKSKDSHCVHSKGSTKVDVSSEMACPCCGESRPCPEFEAHHAVSLDSQRLLRQSGACEGEIRGTRELECETLPHSSERLIALRLAKLKKATLSAIQKREKLPRVLFWSLFHAEVSQLRERRQREREELRAKLFPYAAEDSEPF